MTGEPTGDKTFDSESLRLSPTDGEFLTSGEGHGGVSSSSVGKLPGFGCSLGKTLPHLKGFISSLTRAIRLTTSERPTRFLW